MAEVGARSAYRAGGITLPVTGGCACGALRYSIAADPVIGLHCHCGQCQRLSGTGHGSFLVLRRAAAEVVGEAACWSYVADSGGTTSKYFCGHCGAQVYALLTGHPEGFVVTASSLDDPALFRSTVALFTTEARGWDVAAADLEHYPKGL